MNHQMIAGTGGTQDIVHYLKSRIGLHESISAHETATNFVQKVLNSVDQLDLEQFVSYLAEDSIFRFASSREILGKASIQQSVMEFFSMSVAIRHKVNRVWLQGRTLLVRGEVFYHFKDSRKITVPFFDVFELNLQGEIERYEIYSDLNVS